ncbi:acyl-CoA thioesterase [Desulfobacterales bacterium HSG17]|nr:acyl-CoA thioesterase [Desulfobacterales bacterium HSG17]
MDYKNFNREPTTDVVIRFQDCDPFGHLNNARYIDYFINVREDHLLDYYDLDIYERQKHSNINWVVANTKISYLFPVLFREKVSIRTRLINYNDNSLLMEGVMLDKDRKKLKSIIWIEFKHFDLTSGKLTKHSNELMELFDKISIKGINADYFNERVKEIIRLQKNNLVEMP